MIQFDSTNFSITVIENNHKFYAEITNFPPELAPLILDQVRLYDANDWALWRSQDRKRINSGEASGQTFEPKPGDYEIIGNYDYVMWELENWYDQ